jgi:hypothetical protein
METKSLPHYLPVGFYFAVQVIDSDGSFSPMEDAAFPEVSGISVNREIESIKEGGQANAR